MFARERSAVPHDRMGHLGHELAIVLHALRCLWIKRDPRMDATVAEVPDKRTRVVMLIEQLIEITQVLADILRRNRRIFPTGPRVFDTRNAARADTRLSNLPNLLLIGSIFEQPDGDVVVIGG